MDWRRLSIFALAGVLCLGAGFLWKKGDRTDAGAIAAADQG